MSAPVISFFNNKGGVGKTSLIYHLAWMYADNDWRVLAADLDPQANLTATFLKEDRLESVVFEYGDEADTIYECVQPLIRGVGDVADPVLEHIEADSLSENLALLSGDLSLSKFEDQLAGAWPRCADGEERAFRVASAFWRIMQQAARQHEADLVLMDLGPNLGAINRSALIAADYVVIPLAPDLFSIKGMRNLGPTLRKWREQWNDRLNKNPAQDLSLPEGKMQPVGYTVQQHSVRLDRPAKAYRRWIGRMPNVYREEILEELPDESVDVRSDHHCLALLKHYRSLMPLAQEARKPMFKLKYADGAIGAHAQAAKDTYADFKDLADEISRRIGTRPSRLAAQGHTDS
ncbi:MAG: chromosome partitioning protein [Bacteroidetes bacterium SW_9_63_38]|nr:MAG: chromosome partitioning protein [Bacteroidetes bacterium SW_9_63_38]